MSLRVLIAPDKFKGTLTAHAAAVLIARGWQRIRPADELRLLPMSDGGDGFGAVLASAMELETRETPTVDAAGRPITSSWWWRATTRTAVIESAQTVGLALLPAKRYHPFDLDTFGLGQVLKVACEMGARECLLGIGGSATNDGGFGLARALGWVFRDSAGMNLSQWTELERLDQIVPPPEPIPASETKILVAVDVQNPLLGPAGASRIYGPQKGLLPADLPKAEACLERLAFIVRRDLGFDAATTPGTGAAGGLGFGLHSFLRAHLQSGFEVFAHYARLGELLQNIDLVITGEGAIDRSSLMGKGVGEIAKIARKRGIPSIGLGGLADPAIGPDGLEGLFGRVYGIAPTLATPEEARSQPDILLPRLAETAALDWPQSARECRGAASPCPG